MKFLSPGRRPWSTRSKEFKGCPGVRTLYVSEARESARALSPLCQRERGKGEGAKRSRRVLSQHQDSHRRLKCKLLTCVLPDISPLLTVPVSRTMALRSKQKIKFRF